MCVSCHLIQPFHPLLPPSLFAFNLSQYQGLFQLVALRIRWPKYWSFSFSFSISPSDEYSGLISFRIDWFDLLAVQGTLKSLRAHMTIPVSQLFPLPPLPPWCTYIWSLCLCLYFCLEVMALFLRKSLNVLLTGNVAGRKPILTPRWNFL